MDEREKQRVRQCIRNWKVAAPLLERLRREAIRNTDTAAAIEQFSDACETARHIGPRRAATLVCEASQMRSLFLVPADLETFLIERG